MAIGKRIQMYRKQLGMSQEELGQKLLVSRQTISLWEKDQTTPTIDNLMRLKEVFGVSVDDILNTSDQEADPDVLPSQVIRSNLSKEEVKDFQRGYGKIALRKQRVLVILCFVASVICFFISGSVGVKFAFAFFFLIAAFSGLKIIRTFKKTMKNDTERITQTTYEYKIFEEYLELNIFSNNERIRQSKCYYKEIERVLQFGKWLTFQYGGQYFILRKADLREDSPLCAVANKKQEQEEEDHRPKSMKIVSILLFVLSFLAVMAAFILVPLSSLGMGGKVWVVFLPAVIPLASIIFAIVTKAKGYRNKKNAVVGCIVLPIICLLVLFAFLFASLEDHSDALIVRVEQVMEIDLPEHKSISTQDWTKGTQNVPRGYIYYTSDVNYAQKDVSDFERGLPWNDKWLSSVPSDLIGITNSVYEVTLYEYVLIYNVDTGEFNTIPQNGGPYRFINLLYNTNDNRMMIVEYQIDYTK